MRPVTMRAYRLIPRFSLLLALWLAAFQVQAAFDHRHAAWDALRFDVADNTLSVSKIFDWYRGDCEKGHQGFTSLDATFARYADALGDTPQARGAIRKGGLKIRYLDYDWALNGLPRSR